MGAIKAKLGLRGKTKPGEMISRMNEMKTNKTKALKASTQNQAR